MRRRVAVDRRDRECLHLYEIQVSREKLPVRLQRRMQGVYFSDALWQEINKVSGVGHEVAPVAVEILLNRQQRNGVALRIERQYREVVRGIDGIGGGRMLTDVSRDMDVCTLPSGAYEAREAKR